MEISPDVLQPEDLVHNQLDVSLQVAEVSTSALLLGMYACLGAEHVSPVAMTHILQVARDDLELIAIWLHLRRTDRTPDAINLKQVVCGYQQGRLSAKGQQKSYQDHCILALLP